MAATYNHDAENDGGSYPPVEEDEFSPEEEKSILRRIDLRVTFVCGAMYFIALLDRTNLGAANIAGMAKDLKLTTGNRYNVIALIFYVPYIIFEFPGSALVRKIGVRNQLASIVFLWGCVVIGCGFVTSWKQLAGLRVLLGFFEAGFFPACVYLLSTWYLRYKWPKSSRALVYTSHTDMSPDEVQKRYAVFYFLTINASAFGGILAYGFMQMDGLANLAGWRWIFIMDGIITTFIGMIGYFALVDFPDKASKSLHFLTAREIAWAVRRVDHDRGDGVQEPFRWRPFLAAGLEVKLWLFSLLFCCLTTTAYSIAYFLPLILVHQMGFSVAAAQCLTAPPYVAAGITMLACGWFGDKFHVRSPIIIFNCLLCFIGLSIMTWAAHSGVRYFGSFLGTMGALANVPTAMAYQANNIRGQWRRAFGSATLVVGGGIGGIAGSLIFRSQDAPRYLPGIYGCLVANAIIVLLTLGFTIHFTRENKKAARGEKVIQEYEGFRYTI